MVLVVLQPGHPENEHNIKLPTTVNERWTSMCEVAESQLSSSPNYHFGFGAILIRSLVCLVCSVKDNSIAMIMIIFLAVVLVRKERMLMIRLSVWLWLVGSSICFTFWYSNKLEEEKFNDTCWRFYEMSPRKSTGVITNYNQKGLIVKTSRRWI